MEESCHQQQSIFTRLPKLLRLRRESPAAPTSGQSPASTAKTKYPEVPLSSAVAELCAETGNEKQDFVNNVLIDLLQKGRIKAVRVEGELGYLPTYEGIKYLNDTLAEMVDDALEGIFGDQRDP